MTDPNANIHRFLADLRANAILHGDKAATVPFDLGTPENPAEAILAQSSPIVAPVAPRGIYTRVDARGSTCDRCQAEIPPHGECYAFRSRDLHCLKCGHGGTTR